ncbi:MAG: hypothetical protein LBE09_09340 [Christensenellaceae bacterium]|nr:hypothetical protein [Christensenellaceae bacterium]
MRIEEIDKETELTAEADIAILPNAEVERRDSRTHRVQDGLVCSREILKTVNGKRQDEKYVSGFAVQAETKICRGRGGRTHIFRRRYSRILQYNAQ